MSDIHCRTTASSDGDGANREQKSVISEAICCGKDRSVERRQEEMEAKERDCTLTDGNGRVYKDVVKNESRKNISEIEWLNDEVKMSECTTANVHFTNCQGRALSSVGKLESEVRQLTVWTDRGFQQNRMINKCETSKLGTPNCSLFPLPVVCAHPDDWGGSIATPTPRPMTDGSACSIGCKEDVTCEDPCEDLFKDRMCYNPDTTTCMKESKSRSKCFQTDSCSNPCDGKSSKTPPPSQSNSCTDIFNNCNDRKCFHTAANPSALPRSYSASKWLRANGPHVLQASTLLRRLLRHPYSNMQRSCPRPITPQEAYAVPPIMNPFEHLLCRKTECKTFLYSSLWQSLGIGPSQEYNDCDIEDDCHPVRTPDRTTACTNDQNPLDLNNASRWLVALRKTFLSSGAGTLEIPCYRFCLPSSTNPPRTDGCAQLKSTQIEEPQVEDSWDQHENQYETC